VTWIVAAGETRLAAAVIGNGALLTKPDQTPIVRVAREEIERYAAVAAAGGDSMRPSA
jgi:hypothetical protein